MTPRSTLKPPPDGLRRAGAPQVPAGRVLHQPLATSRSSWRGTSRRPRRSTRRSNGWSSELRELVVALPKEIAAQIAKDRREVDHTLDKGSEDFKEIFRRLAKLEKAVLAIYIIVALVVVGKGLAWFLGVLHIV